MTYSLFLLLFLVVPIAILAFGVHRHIRRWHLSALALVCTVAFVYTTPWDNYAAAKGLWAFAREFVWGPPLWFGWLPLEEYLFYFAEAIFTCLAMVWLSRVRGLVDPVNPESSAASKIDGIGGDA